ncbi:MAG: 1,4-dihydroxy-2-naphthoate polyprenyltransferase [Actinobacteria bacterium]|nr:1,4-dihydroxy-2-naphthoate polyprenyltransferase [Actinomycetota bacterium]
MGKLAKIKIWLVSTRPRTLPAASAPIIMGLALAFYDVRISVLIAVFTLISALLIQIGTNLANDYFDFIKGTDTDKRVGPVRLIQAGMIKKNEMLAAFIITFAIAIFFGVFLVMRGGYPVLIIGFFAVLFGILYTAGPAPLGYIGLGDIFVFIFFGLISVVGTYYLQALRVNYVVFIASIAPGLLSAAILTANNIRDIKTDSQSGKKTLIVRFGYNFGIFEYLFCVIAAHLIPIVLVLITRSHYFSLISVLAIILAIKPVKLILLKSDPKSLIPVLGRTSQMLLIFSVLFSIGWNIKI